MPCSQRQHSKHRFYWINTCLCAFPVKLWRLYKINIAINKHTHTHTRGRVSTNSTAPLAPLTGVKKAWRASHQPLFNLEFSHPATSIPLSCSSSPYCPPPHHFGRLNALFLYWHHFNFHHKCAAFSARMTKKQTSCEIASPQRPHIHHHHRLMIKPQHYTLHTESERDIETRVPKHTYKTHIYDAKMKF